MIFLIIIIIIIIAGLFYFLMVQLKCRKLQGNDWVAIILHNVYVAISQVAWGSVNSSHGKYQAVSGSRTHNQDRLHYNHSLIRDDQTHSTMVENVIKISKVCVKHLILICHIIICFIIMNYSMEMLIYLYYIDESIIGFG